MGPGRRGRHLGEGRFRRAIVRGDLLGGAAWLRRLPGGPSLSACLPSWPSARSWNPAWAFPPWASRPDRRASLGRVRVALSSTVAPARTPSSRGRDLRGSSCAGGIHRPAGRRNFRTRRAFDRRRHSRWNPRRIRGSWVRREGRRSRFRPRGTGRSVTIVTSSPAHDRPANLRRAFCGREGKEEETVNERSVWKCDIVKTRIRAVGHRRMIYDSRDPPGRNSFSLCLVVVLFCCLCSERSKY